MDIVVLSITPGMSPSIYIFLPSPFSLKVGKQQSVRRLTTLPLRPTQRPSRKYFLRSPGALDPYSSFDS